MCMFNLFNLFWLFKSFHNSLEVQAQPKKKKAKEESAKKSETVQPETTQDKANAALPLILKDASDSRTASIKLSNMEYAGELSKQLLEHAQKLEKLYSKLSQDVAGNDEKLLKKYLQEASALGEFGSKAQARFDEEKYTHIHMRNHLYMYTCKHVYMYLLVC